MAAQKAEVSETPLILYSRWALALTAGAMFSYVWRFKVGPIPTTVLEILILATIALYVGSRIQSGGGWVPRRAGLEIPTALLLLAGLLGIAISPDHIGALGIYRAYFLEPVILFYIAIDLLRTPQHFRIVLLGFALGATLFAVLNLGAWALAFLHHPLFDIGRGVQNRYSPRLARIQEMNGLNINKFDFLQVQNAS